MFCKGGYRVLVAMICCMCAATAFEGPAGKLHSHLSIRRALPPSLYVADASELDCHKYGNDLEILAGFPFSVKINPSLSEFYEGHQSVAETSADGTSVQRLAIKYEKVVPSSLFCLSNLTILQIESTPFEKGRPASALLNAALLNIRWLFRRDT